MLTGVKTIIGKVTDENSFKKACEVSKSGETQCEKESTINITDTCELCQNNEDTGLYVGLRDKTKTGITSKSESDTEDGFPLWPWGASIQKGESKTDTEDGFPPYEIDSSVL
jgi:hypothetical protein